MERLPGDGLVTRIAVEIVRPIPIGRLTIDARVVRPGRAVELIEATLQTESDVLARARVWRMAAAPEDLAPLGEPPRRPPAPEEAQVKPFFDTGADVGYHTAMDVRFASGGFTEPGPAQAWMRMRQPLVEDEDPSPLGRLLTAADSGNGVSAALHPREWLFVNVDLVVTIQRYPVGEWVCLDAVTHAVPGGAGLSDTALWDEEGFLGRATQSLLVARRWPPGSGV